MRQVIHHDWFVRTALLLVCFGAEGYARAQAAPSLPVRPQLTAASPVDSRKAVLNDTGRLLQLARELKVSVDKTRRDELSLQVVREADEIEKLARAVKARIH